MNQAIEEIKASLGFISNKLMSIESRLQQPGEDMQEYLEDRPISLGANKLLVAELKSTKITFDLLREEMVDLRQMIVALLKEYR